MYDRARAFIASSDEPIMNAAHMCMFFIAKSLMVDEASTGLQHVQACLLPKCAAISSMYDTFEFPSTHEQLISTAGIDFLFTKYW